MGIGPLWANNDDGTVYMQGHVVIPNPWGNVTTNGTTTTTEADFDAKLASLGISATLYTAIIALLASPEPLITKAAAIALLIGGGIVLGIGIVAAWIARNNCIKKCEEKFGGKSG